MNLPQKHIVLCLILICTISLGFKLYLVDFSVPVHSDNLAYALTRNGKDPNWVHIMQIKSNVLKVLNRLFPEHYTGDEDTIVG